MSIQHQFNTKTIALILSVTVLTVVFGVMLDGQVVPDANKPLLTEESAEKDQIKTSETTKKALAEKRKASGERKREAAANQIEELDQKADATIEKAESLITETNEQIAKAGLKKPSGGKVTTPKNSNITKRLAKARSKLDSLKQ